MLFSFSKFQQIMPLPTRSGGVLGKNVRKLKNLLCPDGENLLSAWADYTLLETFQRYRTDWVGLDNAPFSQ